MQLARIQALLLTFVLILPIVCHAAVAAEGQSVPEAPLALKLMMRWLHILAAIIVAGGTFFMRVVLLPAVVESLDGETNKKLRAAILKRWKRVVHIGVAVFLISGLYNYLAVTRHLHPEQPAYHAMFGIKFLLALAIFALAIVLIGSSALSDRIRNRAPFWLWVLIGLSISVVLIAGYMKLMP